MEIRCSGLSRPMTCAGVLFFKDLPPQEESAAAREGTLAGEYLRFLLDGTQPSDMSAITEEMKFYTEPIADEIKQRAQTKILCETRIDWVARGGIQIRGQYDVSYIGNDGYLYVDDLKYGWGIVEVKNNWQLLAYAIGEIIRRGSCYDVVLRIHQPRPHHEDGSTREWFVTYNELLSYKEQIDARLEMIAKGFKELQTSEKCRYCPAASACPAFSKAFFNGVEVVHQFVQDTLSDDSLARELDLVDRIAEMVKIRQDSLKQLAVSRIKNGGLIPGYVIEPSYGDRKWKKDIGPEVFEALCGKKIVESVMLSPAKAEKIGVPKELVNALVERHFLGQKVVKKDAGKMADKIFGNGKPA